MSKEKTEELLLYLSGLGIKGEKLIAEIKAAIALDLPVFSIQYRNEVPDGIMDCRLQFNKDSQFNAYRLDNYLTVLKKYPPIPSGMVNGIDVPYLEQRMKVEAWEDYFGPRQGYQHQTDLNDVDRTIKLLNELGHTREGDEIKGRLMFKYWPEHAYEHPDKSEMEILFVQTRKFDQTENGICNLSLAYFHLNGTIDHIYEQVMLSGMGEFGHSDVHADLERRFSENPKSFQLMYSVNGPDGMMKIILPITYKDNDHELENPNVFFIGYPKIRHQIIDGIDTAELESRMREVDWLDKKNIYENIAVPSGPMKENVQRIVDEINKISGAGTTDIADQLRLRFWNDSCCQELGMTPVARRLFESLPVMKKEIPSGFSLPMTYNILAGRSVMELPSRFVGGMETTTWIRLDSTGKGMDFKLRKVDGPSKWLVENMLKMLPIKAPEIGLVLRGIYQGNTTAVILEDDRKIRIMALPEQNTICLFDRKMMAIPFNFQLLPEPVFLQQIGRQQIASQEQKQPDKKGLPQKKRNRRNGI